MISKAGFPGNPNFAISTEYNQTVFLIEFKMVDLVGNQFLIIKILKHKKMPNNLNSGIEPTNYGCIDVGNETTTNCWSFCWRKL